MSQTSNLKLNKHDNVETNENEFDIENYLNANWDKIDSLVGKLKENAIFENTVEGQAISVEDAKSGNKNRLEIKGNLYQETREGYNKLKNEATTQTTNGVTFTVNKDGTVMANGTATANIYLNINTNLKLTPNANYYLDGCPSNGSLSTYRLGVWDINWAGIGADVGSGLNIIAPSDGILKVRIAVVQGTTLNNVIFKPMIVEGSEVKPYQTHGIMPSLEYKSNIDVVGDNVNLYDGITETGGITGDGETTDTDRWRAKNYIDVRDYDYVTLKFYDIEYVSALGRYVLYDENKNGLSYIQMTSIEMTIDTSNASYIRFWCLNNRVPTTAKIKLEKGSTATPYSKYNCGNTSVITNNGNLFNTDTVTSELVNATTGAISSNSAWRLSDYIKIEELTDYLFSWISSSSYFQLRVLMYDKDKTFISALSYAQSGLYKKIFQTVEKCSYIRLNYSTNVSGTEVTRENIQLVKGTEEQEYRIFKEGTMTFPFAEGQQLACIKDENGNIVAQDYIDLDSRDIVKKDGKLVLNGTENWQKVSLGTNTYELQSIAIMNDESSVIKAISNYFKGVSFDNRTSGKNIIYVSNYGTLTIRETEFETLSDFKSKLAEQYANGTPVIVYYVLDIEERIAMTEEQKEVVKQLKEFTMLEGYNYIFSKDNISPNMSLTYRQDSNKVLEF